jgi:hypothetical protein
VPWRERRQGLLTSVVRSSTDDLNNPALSCRSCNERKQDATDVRDPATEQIVPLFHPRRDRWEEHFA